MLVSIQHGFPMYPHISELGLISGGLSLGNITPGRIKNAKPKTHGVFFLLPFHRGVNYKGVKSFVQVLFSERNTTRISPYKPYVLQTPFNLIIPVYEKGGIKS